MKIIPVYLPQFHPIPENDAWWGEGFTEWTNVKKAKPLFDGHYQPRVPLNENYYDLTSLDTLKWQAELAKKYGIYGFCIYHYWFNGHLLLEKPMEMLLKHPEIDLKYCISWANHDWTDGWKSGEGREHILIGHDFDDEGDWVAHFNYMLPFFKDPRYITENNKPFMVIYIPNIIRKLEKMLETWTKLARKSGFSGLTYIYQSAMSCFDPSWDKHLFDYGLQFQPGFLDWKERSSTNAWRWRLIKWLRPLKRKLSLNTSLRKVSKIVSVRSYDDAWEKILALAPEDKQPTIPTAFVDWDNTPRKGNDGSVFREATPEKFNKYLKRLIIRAKKVYNTDKIFIFAWNEWAEGGYLEPDEKFKFGYLEAIRDALVDTGEFPNPDDK